VLNICLYFSNFLLYFPHFFTFWRPDKSQQSNPDQPRNKKWQNSNIKAKRDKYFDPYKILIINRDIRVTFIFKFFIQMLRLVNFRLFFCQIGFLGFWKNSNFQQNRAQILSIFTFSDHFYIFKLPNFNNFLEFCEQKY